MELDEILRQQVEIGQLLNSLILRHDRALSDESYSSEITKVRKDISVCFNDLCILNDMLISHNGEIIDNIRQLQKARKKLNDLNEKEKALIREKKLWDEEPPYIPLAIKEPTIINLESRYRPFLTEYTQLTDRLDKVERVEPDDMESKNQLLRSIGLLNASHNSIKNEIKVLQSLLNDLERDNTFIEQEINLKTLRIRNKQITVNNKLQRIIRNKRSILGTCGFKLPDNNEYPITKKFFGLKLNQSSDIETENMIIDSGIDFIDIKIQSLQDELNESKNAKSELLSQKHIWSDCIDAVNDLENRLVKMLENGEQSINPSLLVAVIKETIKYIDSLSASAKSHVLLTLIDSEKAILIKACEELIPGDSKEAHDETKIKNRVDKYNKAALYVPSKSPPKVGIPEHIHASVNTSISDSKKNG